MKHYKTSSKKRKSYRYYFVDGTSTEITLSENVSEQKVKQLHQLDDEAVDAERRESYHIPVHYGRTSEFNSEKNSILVDENNPLEQLVQAENTLEREKLIKKLGVAVQTLTPKQQSTLQKLFYENKSQAEIAKEENVGKSAITYRLRGIYKKLRKELEKS